MRPLNTIELALLPSDEEVELYQQRGYYISAQIFTDAEIDAAVAGSERYYTGERDFPDPNGVPIPGGWKPEHGNVLRKSDYASLVNRDLMALARKPILGAIAARLCGSAVRLWHDQLLYKPMSKPGVVANVGWHADHGYWSDYCTSHNMLTAWIPFHDCFEAMGTITMIEGSHRWPRSQGLDFFDPDLAGLEEKFNTGGQPVCKVSMNLLKGQASFHHCWTIHGSGPNLGDHPRRSMAVHLQDAANHYRETRLPDGGIARHPNHVLCRSVNGQPDYTDPVVCPQLWP